MKSATAYGALLVVVWAIWFSYHLLKKERHIVLLFVGSLISFLVILWTGTRMALVGIVVASFCISVIQVLTSRFTPLVKTTILIFTPFFLFIFFLITWQIVPDDLTIKRSFNMMLSGKIDGSNLGRIIGWIGALEAFSKHPFFGIGNGNFLGFLEDFASQNGINVEILGTVLVPHAHNLYLIILSENGLFGFSIILFIFLSVVYNYIRYLKKSKRKEDYCLLVGLFVLCTLCLFDSMPFYPPTLAWGAWFLGSLLQISFKRDNLDSSDLCKSTPHINPEFQSV
jgi:O-antigen ligase